MYTAATFRLSQVLPFTPLAVIARAFLPIALVAWLLTAFGLLRELLPRRPTG
jgi:hypothetical protein